MTEQDLTTQRWPEHKEMSLELAEVQGQDLGGWGGAGCWAAIGCTAGVSAKGNRQGAGAPGDISLHILLSSNSVCL